MTRACTVIAILVSLWLVALPRTVVAQTTAGIPGCTVADPSVAVPDAPHGLFASNINDTSSTTERSLVVKYLVHDPTVCGANLVVPWSAVDRGPGSTPRYDWSSVDTAAQPWFAAGKTINLVVWGVAETKSQELGQPVTPAYVLHSVHTVQCAGANLPATPIYWEPGYRDNYRQFMRAVVAHYAHLAHIGYIRFGIGTGGEDYPANNLRGGCLRQWSSYGLSEARWQRYSEDTIRFEHSLHSPKQLMVGLNDLIGAPGPQLPDAVAGLAAADGLGFGMQGLTTNAITSRRQNKPCYANWCALFEKYAGKAPLELQTYSRSNPNGQGKTGPLPPLLAFGLKEHAQIFELYPQEWLLADDPTYPGYEQYHAVYTQALRQAAREVGADLHSAGPPPADGVQVIRDVPYIQPADEARSGDLYLPATDTTARPAVVVIHGGAWVAGSKEAADTVFISQGLAQHGDVAFDINYRLAGQGGNFPYDVQDVKDAIAFLAANAARWNIDVHRLAVTGTSAGGHLALMAGYTPNTGMFAPPHYPGSTARVVAAGSFFGPTDFTSLPSTATVALAAEARYVGASLASDPGAFRTASPVTYISQAVPTIMIHGTADQTVPYSQSVELDSLLKNEQVTDELLPISGGMHGLGLGLPGPQQQMELAKLIEFFDGVFSGLRPQLSLRRYAASVRRRISRQADWLRSGPQVRRRAPVLLGPAY